MVYREVLQSNISDCVCMNDVWTLFLYDCLVIATMWLSPCYWICFFSFMNYSIDSAAPGKVSNLKVSRTADNKTVHAQWDKLDTTPPVGVVEVYHIEYRQFTRKSVSSIRNSPDRTIVIISNVIDADSYEVCEMEWRVCGLI